MPISNCIAVDQWVFEVALYMTQATELCRACTELLLVNHGELIVLDIRDWRLKVSEWEPRTFQTSRLSCQRARTLQNILESLVLIDVSIK